MVQIHYEGSSYTISKLMYENLILLLPYWGLKIDKNNIIQGIGFHSPIEVSGLSDTTMMELERLLSHTGIYIRKGANSYFHITYKNGEETPLSIRIRSVTYRFRPTLLGKAQVLKEHIFKNIWLPMRVQPIHVFVNPKYFNYVPEWLCYLLIQYVTPPADLSDLASITLKDYQHITSHFLKKINPEFALIQQWHGKESEDWPDFPMQSCYLDDLIRPVEDEEEIEEDGEPTIRPFRPGNQIRDPEPINPFKLEPSAQSIINPFRNKKSKD